MFNRVLSESIKYSLTKKSENHLVLRIFGGEGVRVWMRGGCLKNLKMCNSFSLNILMPVDETHLDVMRWLSK